MWMVLALLGCEAMAEAPVPIRVGVILPLSGPMATFGKSAQQGMDTYSVRHQMRVAGHPLALDVRDSQGDAPASATAAQTLVDAGAVALLGEIASSNTLAIARLSQTQGIPLLSPTSTNPTITTVGDFVFRICVADPSQGDVMAGVAASQLKLRRVGILEDTQSSYSHALTEHFQTRFRAAQGQTWRGEYQSGDVYFEQPLRAILRHHPQALYLPGYYTDVALIMEQARKLGFRGQFLGGDGWDSAGLLQRGEAPVGGLFSNHFVYDDPQSRAFVNDFHTISATPPDAIAALYHDAMTVLVAALEQVAAADPDHFLDDPPAKIRGALRTALAATHDLPVTTGRFAFDADRNAVRPMVIVTVRRTGVPFGWFQSWPPGP